MVHGCLLKGARAGRQFIYAIDVLSYPPRLWRRETTRVQREPGPKMNAPAGHGQIYNGHTMQNQCDNTRAFTTQFTPRARHLSSKFTSAKERVPASRLWAHDCGIETTIHGNKTKNSRFGGTMLYDAGRFSSGARRKFIEIFELSAIRRCFRLRNRKHRHRLTDNSLPHSSDPRQNVGRFCQPTLAKNPVGHQGSVVYMRNSPVISRSGMSPSGDCFCLRPKKRCRTSQSFEYRDEGIGIHP